MSKEKNRYLICPTCLTIEKYRIEITPIIPLCSNCSGKIFSTHNTEKPLDTVFNYAYREKIDGIRLYEGFVSDCACGGDRVSFLGMSNCQLCGKREYAPGVYLDRSLGAKNTIEEFFMISIGEDLSIGNVIKVFNRLKDIPKRFFEFQKSGDTFIFGGKNPLNNENIYFIWQWPIIPKKKKQ